jgi:adenosylcobyric acid synthase
MAAKVLMIQGAGSSVGKSLLAAGLCRIFARKGLRVAPFKAQNMSNNAAVCDDGAEIGRAQAVQAAAAGVAPVAEMNPVLLKPEADSRSQVIVLGRPWRTLQAGSYYHRKDALWPVVTAALDRLRSTYELVVIEGAGSPAELNLRSFDIVNMAVARYARAPVLLVGDIDRGGVFAQLLGTLWLLGDEDRTLVRGFVVNKFRGDPALFSDGVRILQERGGVPVLGVVPWLPALAIPEEDSVALQAPSSSPLPSGRGEGSGVRGKVIDIAVIHLPHIANFDDFDALRESGVRLRYVQSPGALGTPHAVILPGTKSTLADLAWLRAAGLDESIRALAQRGTAVAGICGGYQMLGRMIRDPGHIESTVSAAAGLGLLPVETTFEAAKATFQVRAWVLGGPGWLATAAAQEVEGYEIHMGRTTGGRPWLRSVSLNGAPAERTDGAASADGRIWGCYLHGLFANPALRRLWLASLLEGDKVTEAGTHPVTLSPCHPVTLSSNLDRLADAVESALDMRLLEAILDQSNPK